jgi:hypothetical protein
MARRSAFRAQLASILARADGTRVTRLRCDNALLRFPYSARLRSLVSAISLACTYVAGLVLPATHQLKSSDHSGAPLIPFRALTLLRAQAGRIAPRSGMFETVACPINSESNAGGKQCVCISGESFVMS